MICTGALVLTGVSFLANYKFIKVEDKRYRDMVSLRPQSGSGVCELKRGLASVGCEEQNKAQTLDDKNTTKVVSVLDLIKQLSGDSQKRIMQNVENALAQEIFRKIQGISATNTDQMNAIAKNFGQPTFYNPAMFSGNLQQSLAAIQNQGSTPASMVVPNMPGGEAAGMQTTFPASSSIAPIDGTMIPSYNGTSILWSFKPSVTGQIGMPIFPNYEQVFSQNPFGGNVKVQGNQVNTAVFSPVGIQFAKPASSNTIAASAIAADQSKPSFLNGVNIDSWAGMVPRVPAQAQNVKRVQTISVGPASAAKQQ